MSTIRPLATIAILAVVGVFLAQKINENPAATDEGLSDWGAPSEASPAGDAAPVADTGMLTGAPPIGVADFPPEAAPAGDALPAPVAVDPAALDADPFGSEEPAAEPVGTISGRGPFGSTETPPLPPLPASPATTPPATSGTPIVDVPLPDNIPTANYDGSSTTPTTPTTPTAAATATPVASPPLPPLPPIASATAAAPFGALPPSATAPPVATPPVASLPPVPPPAPPVTPFASAAATAPFPSVNTSGYAAAKPAIDAALATNQLSRALLMLSAWHGDATLSPAERQEVDTLLGQLAGTVIYSNQHLIEGPYTVKPGETLETIAQQHGVPWELLGKINGVASAAGVQPGQTIKVFRGPFRATVDLSDNELFLTIDGRYAGKFPVQLDGAAASEGSWRIEQKQTAVGKQLVLSGAAGASYGQQVTITDTPSPTPPPAGRGSIVVAGAGLNDLYDILSVGSEVTVRR